MKKSKTKKSNPSVVDTFNVRELAVVTYLAIEEKRDALLGRNANGGAIGARGLGEIAVGCFDRKLGRSVKASSYFRANSWARNAVRRPLRERIIRRVGTNGSGTYKITVGGARLLASKGGAK